MSRLAGCSLHQNEAIFIITFECGNGLIPTPAECPGACVYILKKFVVILFICIAWVCLSHTGVAEDRFVLRLEKRPARRHTKTWIETEFLMQRVRFAQCDQKENTAATAAVHGERWRRGNVV